MSHEPLGHPWKTLDTDLNRISQVEYATAYVARPLVGPGIALAFIVLAGLAAAEAKSLEAALQTIARDHPGARVVICGSLYLAGAVLAGQA